MSGAARTLALVAVIAACVLSATPATASAGVGATVCSVAGWFSGAAGKVCSVASDPGRVLNAGKKLAGGHVGGAIGALTGSASKTVARAAGIAAITAGVIGGAQLALKLTVKAVGAWTNPNLEAVWFSSSYWRMAAVSALLTVPFLFAAAIQAMLRSDLTLLLRSAFGYLPLGLLAVGVAAPVTALLLAGSDEMSSIVASASGHAGASFLDRVGSLGGLISGASGTAFVSFFIALFTIAAAVTLWLELLIREAAVYVIVLMLPLFFAAMVWPARRIWAIRAVELLVALILSKFAIVAVLGLGGAALGHTLIPGVGSFLAGTTLVLLAAFSPWAMLRLLPLHELAGAAVGGLRPHATPPPQVTSTRAEGATDATEDAASGGGAGRDAAGRDAASEDVAARLPARLLTLMRRDGTGAEGAEGEDAATTTATTARDADPSPVDPLPAASHPGASAPASTASGAADQAPAPAPVPETDAFGPTVRHGELPAVFQDMSLDGDVLHLGPPMSNGTEATPDAGPPALPDLPAPLEPEGDPE
ncbi:MAG TPA: hypothetical protein VHW96_05650 [Solirubrobacteraceae bacterium]|jgi:hypothetical protein|nr:hypothetical protein [Solirubrobacteraceae bacterium]